MAKKESMNEKIVRLYREGHHIEEIARSLEMPKDNVRMILEKYMDDFETFVQPEIDHSAADDDKSKKGGFPFFGRGGKSSPAPAPAANDGDNAKKVSLNLAMDENGFVDRKVSGIASMLQKGRSVKDTAEFFNLEIIDVEAVKRDMDEHFKRLNSVKVAVPEAESKSDDNKPHGRTNIMTSGLEPQEATKAKEATTPKPAVRYEAPKPISASYGMAPASLTINPVGDNAKDTAAPAPAPQATPTLATLTPEVKEDKHEVKLVPDDYVEPVQVTPPKPANSSDEEIPEMPSIEPVSLDSLGQSLVKAPKPVADIPSVGGAIVETIGVKADEEEANLSPMEKMKRFAENQIQLNNKKIEDLKDKKISAENIAFDCNTKVENMQKQIENQTKTVEKLKKDSEEFTGKIDKFNEQAEGYKLQAADVDKQAEELKKKLAELEDKSATLKAKAANANTEAEKVKNEAADTLSKTSEAEKKQSDLKAQLEQLIEAKNKAGSAVEDIYEEIENIKKENEEFASYIK